MTVIAPSTTPTPARPAPRPSLDPAAIARGLLAEHGGARGPDLGAIKREIDAIRLQDPALGAQVRAAVGALLTPVQDAQLDRATYKVGPVTVDPAARPLPEQFKAPRTSPDGRNYARLDTLFGDGNPRTDDVARIQRAVDDLTISGLSLEQLAAKHKAEDAGWTAAVGDFMAKLSPGAYVAEALRPAAAALARDAGLARTPWGASLQRVLDRPGTATAFNAGVNQGLVEGGRDLVVSLATLAGRAVQHGADQSAAGRLGDLARAAVPQGVKDWLGRIGAAEAVNAALPSYQRGEATNRALGQAGANIGRYLATHAPAEIAADVKAKIGEMWDGLKADHAAAARRGPEAEARWWGRVVGRATFEVASTFIPVAGVAGKGAKGAKAVDAAVDVANAANRTGDAAQIAKAAGAGRVALTIEGMAASLRSAAATELSAMRAAGMYNKQIGPVVSVVMDRTTGRMSRVYINAGVGELPPQMNAVLAKRLAGAEALDYAKTKGAGTHAEVFAVNELLNRGSKLENLLVYTEQVGTARAGSVKPPCPHCAHLLDGVTYVR